MNVFIQTPSYHCFYANDKLSYWGVGTFTVFTLTRLLQAQQETVDHNYLVLTYDRDIHETPPDHWDSWYPYILESSYFEVASTCSKKPEPFLGLQG